MIVTIVTVIIAITITIITIIAIITITVITVLTVIAIITIRAPGRVLHHLVAYEFYDMSLWCQYVLLYRLYHITVYNMAL